MHPRSGTRGLRTLDYDHDQCDGADEKQGWMLDESSLAAHPGWHASTHRWCACAAQTALVNSAWDLSSWYLHPPGRWGTHPFVTHWAGCKLCARAEKFKPDAKLANGTVVSHRIRCMAIYDAYVAHVAARVRNVLHSIDRLHNWRCLIAGGRRTAQRHTTSSQ